VSPPRSTSGCPSWLFSTSRADFSCSSLTPSADASRYVRRKKNASATKVVQEHQQARGVNVPAPGGDAGQRRADSRARTRTVVAARVARADRKPRDETGSAIRVSGLKQNARRRRRLRRRRRTGRPPAGVTSTSEPVGSPRRVGPPDVRKPPDRAAPHPTSAARPAVGRTPSAKVDADPGKSTSSGQTVRRRQTAPSPLKKARSEKYALKTSPREGPLVRIDVSVRSLSNELDEGRDVALDRVALAPRYRGPRPRTGGTSRCGQNW